MPAGAGATTYTPPWADVMYSHWPDLDTTNACTLAAANLSTYGGYHSFCTNPVDADVAMGSSYAQSDAIWFMAGHGNIGIITTYNTTHSTTYVAISSSVPQASCSSPNTCLTNYTLAEMHGIRLMVFEGCDTGATIANGDSLPKRATSNLGVDSAVGFSGTIYFPQGERWANIFTSSLTESGERYTVYTSAWDAANSVYN